MAKRYLARGSFSLGRGKRFNRDFIQPDGTAGYTREQLDRLTKDQVESMFDVVEVTGSIVEEATAAPGEKRNVPKHECSEDGCDFTSRTAAGIAAHERSH